MERLVSDLKTAESGQKEHDLLKQEATELRSHLSCVREELEDSLDTNAKGQDRIRDLENQSMITERWVFEDGAWHRWPPGRSSN